MDSRIQAHKKWLKFAIDDLHWTEANLKEKIWYGVCFTAQQASEKALKAYLVKHDRTPRRIHDLGALLEECFAIDASFENLRRECITLTDYYAPARYPDIAEFIEFDEQKAQEAYQFAKKIIQFVQDKS